MDEDSESKVFQIHSVDFVLVWDGGDDEAITKEANVKRQIFEYNLKSEGLILTEENTERTNLMFVKIRATIDVLRRYAEILKYRMPLKEVKIKYGFPIPMETQNLRPISRRIISAKNWCCDTLNCLRVSPSLFPQRHKRFTATYSRDKEYLFDVDESETEFFTSSVRARIIFFILRRTRYAPEPENFESDGKSDFKFGIDRLLKSHVYLAAYPLHDGDVDTPGSQRYLLSREWASFTKCLKYQPLFAIKEYFGIKIALYFAWLGFYTRMLIPAAIVGILCFTYGAATIDDDQYSNDVCDPRLNITMCPMCDLFCDYWKINKACFHAKLTHLFDNDTTVFFAAFMSIWTAAFLEYWKRYVAQLTYRWDLTGFDVKDQYPRPEYLARLKNVKKKKVNPVTRISEPLVSFFRHRLPYTLLSISTVTLLIILAAAAVLAVVVYRLTVKLAFNKLANNEPEIQSMETLVVTITAAILNLLFIIFFNWLYEGVAEKLTEWELHRTQYEFDDSYTFKIYLLQFVNYYSSIFYIAFFKGIYVGSPAKFIKLFGEWRQEECKIGCMPELCIQLAVVMIGKQLKSFIFELIVPIYQNCQRNAQLKELNSARNHPEKQWIHDFKLTGWSKKALVDEYIEMVIQYGFVTIFVTAFPLAPFFALLNNIFEVRLDAKKLIHYQRRPIPLRVKDIGVWYPIMEFIGKFAVLSNAFIIAITSKFIPKLVYRFSVFEYGDPQFGTLIGFLNHSLTSFHTSELQTKPLKHLVKTPTEICRYPVYRHNYNEDPNLRYKPNEFYWRVWLARVVFILLFQNIIATIVMLIRWIIPDVPQKLRDKIDREEYLTNEYIIQHELNRLKNENNSGHGGCGSTLTLHSTGSQISGDNLKNKKFNYVELNETVKTNGLNAAKSQATLDEYQNDFIYEELSETNENEIVPEEIADNATGNPFEDAEPENPFEDAEPENPFEEAEPENPPENAEPENPPEDTEPENPPDDTEPENPPEDAEPENPPEDAEPENPPENAEPENQPEDAESENLPEDAEPENLPEDAEPENPPEDAEPENAPEEAEPENAPEDAEPENAPEDAEPENAPEDAELENAPEEVEPEIASEDAEPENSPEDAEPENSPEEVEPENHPEEIIDEGESENAEKKEDETVDGDETKTGDDAENSNPSDADHKEGENTDTSSKKENGGEKDQ